MTKNQLKILRKSLPRGTYVRLANEFGYSKHYINSILFGSSAEISREEVLSEIFEKFAEKLAKQ